MGRALAHRNFRLFFFGQGISLIGTWMQQIALFWLAYRLSHSALFLGLVGFASQIPAAVITPLAGVTDRSLEPAPHVFIAQVAAMIQAFVLAALTFSGVICGWQIVAAERFRRPGDGVRRARPAKLPGANGRGPRRSGQRHRLELFNVQRGPADRPGHRRSADPLLGEWPCFLINA